MFSYYGAKTKIIDYYPAPKHDKIIEPFAGSARYALKYWKKDVVLYETFPKVCAIWEFLINATAKDIISMPNVEVGDDIRNFKQLSDAERWLMGYFAQRGNARPGNLINARCRWNKDKLRVASEVHKVKHWKLKKYSSFEDDWNEQATYFIDPPYMNQKHGYNHGAVDYAEIKKRVDNGVGQFIVCGNSHDTWLDFKPLKEMYGINKKHIECIYMKG